MGKGNKWFEKLNIVGWEKLSAWRVKVCDVPETRPWSSWQRPLIAKNAMNRAQLLRTSASLMTGPPAENPIPGPLVGIRGSHPFRDENAERMGHPNLWADQDFKNSGCAIRPPRLSDY